MAFETIPAATGSTYTPLFKTNPLVNNIHVSAGVMTPTFGVILSGVTSASAYPFWGMVTAPTVSGTPIWSWDATLKRWFAAGTTAVSNVWTLWASSAPINPFGPGAGRFPSFANSAGALLPATNYTKLVMEFLGKFTSTPAAFSNQRGFGVGANGFNIAAGFPGMQFWRKNNGAGQTGWTITSSDGTTISDLSEAADSSDSNTHIFRLEWGSGTATLFVDGVSKVTKATNMPADTSNVAYTIGAGVGAAADASSTTFFSAFMGYWQ